MQQSMRQVLVFLLLLATTIVSAQEMENNNTSSAFFSKEGDFDVSGYLSEAYGFLPVPILITEPAIGYGGGVALVFLHDKFVGRKGASGRNIPSSMSGIILAATENETKIAGAFHLGYYMEDTLRTQTFVMATNVNINFYTPTNRAIFMNLETPIAYQSVKKRVFESDVFLGLSYLYASTELSLNKIADQDITLPTIESTNAALGLIVDYDTRDNVLSPNKGMLFNARVNLFDEKVGSDNDFQKYFLQELLYVPLSSNINLDHRFIFDKIVGEDAPFYMYPAVNMRGVPALRYQGENVALYEAQLSYAFTERWTGVLFGGVARAYGESSALGFAEDLSFSDASTVVSKGLGFRYLIAEKFGLRVGVDIAKSNDDSAFYIQFGTAWMGL
ncbi:MAG: BamA/TamA family outer membrane protein [Sulfurovum sp.]|nr:BamA/TamA family outer membrane protein [Sulfurovum sp.]